MFIGAFIVHVAFRLSRAGSAVRAGRGFQAAPGSPEAADLVSPAPATISRRGAVAMVGAGSLALAVYAGIRLLTGNTVGVAIWFVGAAVVHDLVLLPLYSVTDLTAQRLFRGRRAPGGEAGDGRA